MPQTQQTNSSQTSNPWGPQTNYLTQGFADAAGALSKAQSSGVTPTGFVAQMTPDQLATFKSMVGYGNANAGVPAAETGAGTALLSPGTLGLSNAVSGLGSFNPAATNNMGAITSGANAYAKGIDIPAQVQAALQSEINTARDVTIPGITEDAAGTGNINSSRAGIAQGLVQRGLAEDAGNVAANLEANAYNTGAGLASNTAQSNNEATLSALTGLGGAGSAALSGGAGALSDAINNAGNLYNIAGTGGSGEQAAQQANFDNQNQAYSFSQNAPFQALNNFWNIVGSNNWGGTSTGSQTQTTTPSMFSVIGGLLGAGGSLAGGLGKNGLGWMPFA